MNYDDWYQKKVCFFSSVNTVLPCKKVEDLTTSGTRLEVALPPMVAHNEGKIISYTILSTVLGEKDLVLFGTVE